MSAFIYNIPECRWSRENSKQVLLIQVWITTKCNVNKCEDFVCEFVFICISYRLCLPKVTINCEASGAFRARQLLLQQIIKNILIINIALIRKCNLDLAKGMSFICGHECPAAPHFSCSLRDKSGFRNFHPQAACTWRIFKDSSIENNVHNVVTSDIIYMVSAAPPVQISINSTTQSKHTKIENIINIKPFSDRSDGQNSIAMAHNTAGAMLSIFN